MKELIEEAKFAVDKAFKRWKKMDDNETFNELREAYAYLRRLEELQQELQKLLKGA